ncbi:hypothetical protein K8I61_06075 [bacterium]|nr:hypothetical protein [bacterium]
MPGVLYVISDVIGDAISDARDVILSEAKDLAGTCRRPRVNRRGEILRLATLASG